MFLAVGYAPISSSAPRPLEAAYIPILLSEVEQERVRFCRNYYYNVVSYVHIHQCPKSRSEAKRSDVLYSSASMLLLGEGSEATEPYNKYDKIRPHSNRSLQFDQKVRPLSFRPEKFDQFTATRPKQLDQRRTLLQKYPPYFDDRNLRDDCRTVLKNLKKLLKQKKRWDSKMNPQKAKSFSLVTEKRRSTFLASFQNICSMIKTPKKDELIILGSPLGPKSQAD